MYYIEEEKRGFYPEEYLSVTGVYEIDLSPNEEKDIYFICSFEHNIEEINVKEMISNEIIRINNLITNSNLSVLNKKGPDFYPDFFFT